MTSGTIECPRCRRTVPWTDQAWDSGAQACRDCVRGTQVTPLANDLMPMQGRSTSQTRVALSVAGLLFFGIGMFLLFNPEAPPAINRPLPFAPESSGVVNLQRLFLGETFSIVGAVFLAAAWRPL
jgi:hypothetical protein